MSGVTKINIGKISKDSKGEEYLKEVESAMDTAEPKDGNESSDK